ncbi:MAG TPA: RdgB/HAM1 family non-canonical purine NTP pyrophosphatase [Polyangiaceae bacterium]
MKKLVLATTNHGKLVELRALLSGKGVEVVSVAEASTTPFEVVEDGDTFVANAIKKAKAAAALTGLPSLADDSGLEVDALGGAPGVRSARYAGEHATDAENKAALLRALAKKTAPNGGYPARFRCALALVDPSKDGDPLVVDGTCEGWVVLAEKGNGGFGYDPLFVVEGSEKTMAELSEAEKNRVSHRGKALAKLLEKL